MDYKSVQKYKSTDKQGSDYIKLKTSVPNYEFYEETMGDDKGIQIMHDIDQMWEVEENIRWNRICHRISAKGSANTEGIQLAVETFRHHRGETK